MVHQATWSHHTQPFTLEFFWNFETKLCPFVPSKFASVLCFFFYLSKYRTQNRFGHDPSTKTALKSFKKHTFGIFSRFSDLWWPKNLKIGKKTREKKLSKAYKIAQKRTKYLKIPINRPEICFLNFFLVMWFRKAPQIVHFGGVLPFSMRNQQKIAKKDKKTRFGGQKMPRTVWNKNFGPQKIDFFDGSRIFFQTDLGTFWPTNHDFLGFFTIFRCFLVNNSGIPPIYAIWGTFWGWNSKKT